MAMDKIMMTVLLLLSVTGCTAGKSPPAATGETEWGYKKLPYDQWKFLFIYPWALPALATQALMVDGAGYKTTYQYVDNTEPSKVSVGRWNDHLGVT
ncbi:TPA: type VI secretion protein, partial [Yersinia enterocolitica]